MTDLQADRVEIRTMFPMPDGARPRRRRRLRLPSGALPPDNIPASRPTVQHPTAFPFGAVALLNFFKRTPGKPRYLGFATGFFVKPDLVLTAGHNLTLSGADIIGVYPAWDSHLNQSHVISALRWVPTSARDIGMLLTQPGPGTTVSLNGATTPQAQLVGYASDYPDGKNRMSSGAGPCHLQGTKLVYAIDAQQADSGAPIFSSNNLVMAIHRELLPGQGGTVVGGGEHVDAALITLAAQLEARLRGHP